MKKILFIVLCLCFFSLKSHATHIVGGEVRLIYLGTNNNYRIVLNVYFDNINGSPTAIDPTLNVGVYSKTSRNLIQFFTLNQISQTNIPYSGDACQTGALSTNIILYSLDVVLNPALYSEIGGYLMVWERCCRNNVITNITIPGAASNAFYAEFPALIRAGLTFRNTSPDLGLPPSDYLCVNQSSTINFGGTDPDGDVLVYSLVTPYNGAFATNTAPSPFTPTGVPSFYPAIIPNINWAAGFSATNAISSNVGQPLSINAATGVLSVNPNLVGLFVFSVKCEEFRAGVKIGEIKRDFQFLVKNCPANIPPILTLNTPQGNPYNSATDMVMDFSNNDPNCMTLIMQDTPNDIITQIRVIPVSTNFTSADYTITTTRLPIGVSGVVQTTLCWNFCKVSTSTTDKFIFDIQVFDAGCPTVGTATRRITLFVIPKPPIIPLIAIVGSTPNFNPVTQTANVVIDDFLRIDVRANDPNNGLIILSASGTNASGAVINFSQYGASFITRTGTGVQNSSFFLTPTCATLPLNQAIDLIITFKVRQQTGCVQSEANLIVNVRITPKPTIPPIIAIVGYTPNFNPITQTANVLVDELLRIDVQANDPNNRLIMLSASGTDASGTNIDFSQYGASFTTQTGTGILRSSLSFTPLCTSLPLNQPRNLQIRFKVRQQNDCPQSEAIIVIDVRIVPKPAILPMITIAGNTTNFNPITQTATLNSNDTLRIDIEGKDPNNGIITLSASGTDERDTKDVNIDFVKYNASFIPKTGTGTLNSSFLLITSCEYLKPNEQINLKIKFKITQKDGCPQLADSLIIRVKIKETEIDFSKFMPYNVFTPNEDGKNAYYALDNLPKENCTYSFRSFVVYNRWGKEVYQTNDKNFKWKAENLPSGLYYYYLDYDQKKYKGHITVLF